MPRFIKLTLPVDAFPGREYPGLAYAVDQGLGSRRPSNRWAGGRHHGLYRPLRATHRNHDRQDPGDRELFHGGGAGFDRPSPANSAMAFVSLKPWEERTGKQQEIAADLVLKLQSLPGVLAFPINPAPLGQSFRQTPIQFVIQAGSFQELLGLVAKLMEKASAFPGS